MKNLVIVESPNKIKKIQSFLDKKNYKVIASVGHIRDLKKYGTKLRLGIDLEEMTPIYENLKDKKAVIEEIIKEANNADKIFLATDPDREGEAIAWHIEEIIKLNAKNEKLQIYRIIFNEITAHAVLHALKNANELDMNLVDSQEARRMLDRIIGFRLSYLTRRKLSAPSAGRVKSATLKLIIDRENEIEKFLPVIWWVVEPKIFKERFMIHIDNFGKEIKFDSEAKAEAVFKTLSEIFILSDKVEKTVKIPAPKPLEMATFLIAMFNTFRMSNIQATFTAQSLYEKGLITYPRTDSIRISSKEFLEDTKKYISAKYAGLFAEIKNNENGQTKNQDAHEAIRPTDIYKSSSQFSDLNTYEKKVYDFIRNITIKSFMIDGLNNAINFIYKNNQESFVLKTSVPIELGFRTIDVENKIQDLTITDDIEITTKKELKIKKTDILITKRETIPPARYNQASIIKKLKTEGIGRPSTYAVTTSGLINYGYIQKEKGSLVPTDFAKDVNKMLLNSFRDIINEKYTAQMEQILDEISLGNVNSRVYLKDFWKDFEPRIVEADKTIEVRKPKLVNRKCPNCGGELVYKNSRFGSFIGCENFPTCKYVESLKEKFEPIVLKTTCPLCQEGNLLIKKSKFKTFFIGCSNYPKCKFIMNKNEAEAIITKYIKK